MPYDYGSGQSFNRTMRGHSYGKGLVALGQGFVDAQTRVKDKAREDAINRIKYGQGVQMINGQPRQTVGLENMKGVSDAGGRFGQSPEGQTYIDKFTEPTSYMNQTLRNDASERSGKARNAVMLAIAQLSAAKQRGDNEQSIKIAIMNNKRALMDAMMPNSEMDTIFGQSDPNYIQNKMADVLRVGDDFEQTMSRKYLTGATGPTQIPQPQHAQPVQQPFIQPGQSSVQQISGAAGGSGFDADSFLSKYANGGRRY